MYIKEITASIYAWDCADEGIKNTVDNLQQRCGINSLYLVGIIHHEKRPLTSLFFTHNPARKYFIPQNSRMYYKPDLANFKNLRLQPLVADDEFGNGKDWINIMTQEARNRKLRTGVELSHTIFDTDIAAKEFSDLLQVNVLGEPVIGLLPHICPNNPDVHDYICSVFYDVVKNHDIDFIQTALFGFNIGQLPKAPWHFNEWMDVEKPRLSGILAAAQGGCFCNCCKDKMKKAGYDVELITKDIAHLLKVSQASNYKYQEQVMENNLLLGSDLTETGLLADYPGVWQFINFRMDSMTELFKDVSERIHSVNKKIDFRFNNCFKLPEYSGYSIRRIAPFIDSLRDSDYLEQYGKPGNFAIKRGSILSMRRGIGFEKNLLAAIPIRPNATADIIKQSLKVLKTLGIDGISIAHYDNASFEHMDAFGQGLKEESYVVCDRVN